MVLKNKKKTQTVHNSSVGVVGEDQISNLPDEIIHHILSLLPIKCAMSTCILSKRWNYVSNSTPILDFRKWQGTIVTVEEKRLETQKFMNFLDTVIYLHEKPNIKKFFLTWDDLFDETRVIKWIGIVIKRRVEELFLRSLTPFVFPLSLFTRNSLTLLDLFSFKLNVPNTVSFPRLKLLRLNCIKFVNGISLNNLLSNCPILEELSLINCNGFESEGLLVANLALKHLRICQCYFQGSTVKIYAPNLTTISLRLEKSPDILIDSFPSLVEADIQIYGGDKIPIKLFEKLSNVMLLKMHGACFLGQREVDILSTILPSFNNLIHLEVSLINCESFGSDCSSIVRRFFSLLQLPPNLETIVFSQGIYIPDERDAGCWSLDPKRSPPHLKSIKFKNFNGGQMELNAIKIFLKYASFLETVTIIASPELSKDLKKQLKYAKHKFQARTQGWITPISSNCTIPL